MIELDPIACSDGRVGNSDTGPVLSLQILFRQSSLEHGVMYLRFAKTVTRLRLLSGTGSTRGRDALAKSPKWPGLISGSETRAKWSFMLTFGEHSLPNRADPCLPSTEYAGVK
jgi:hypothetical protein